MKYYQPKLEEFFPGFEFEELDFETEMWNKRICWYNDYEELFHNDGLVDCRVKYLDEQDIKELGWELTSTNGMVLWFHGKEEWFGKEIPGSPLYKYWHHTLTFDSKYSSIKIECTTSNGDTDTFFEGIIKNKSELIKLMNQLGI